MAFTEPATSLIGLKLETPQTDTCVAVLRDQAGTPLEIRFIQGAGWWFEARYDLVNKAVKRQPFTGRQDVAPLVPLQCSVQNAHAEIRAGKEDIASINLSDGSFTLARGEEYFRSAAAPFRSHPESIDVSEFVVSRKVTHFEPGQLPPPYGIRYRSRMSRFVYPRPRGIVLGLPGQSGEMNRNGYRFELYNTDDPVHTPGRNPLYQSWPILFQPDGTGGWSCIFHDNPSRTFVDIGDFYPESVTFESITGNTRVFILAGRELSDVTQKLSLILGQAVFPPAWAFGYQQCRWSYLSTDEVSNIAARFRAEKIPCDAMYFDIHHMDGYRVFTKDPKKFSDLDTCLDALHAQNFHAICIVDPGVKSDPAYPLNQQLTAINGYIKTRTGEPFPVNVWPGACSLPDFYAKNVRELWSDAQCKWLASNKFDGIWNDMNEPSNFDGRNTKTSEAFTADGSIQDVWNLYGYRMAEASALGWRKLHPSARSFIISRSGYPGMQQFCVNWQGDNYAWWEHLRLAIDTTITYSLCGSLYTGADVPGFQGNPTEDLAVRFYQLGAFLPFFRGHSTFPARDKEPFAFEPSTVKRLRDAITLRYSLLREWYSGFERAARRGQPIVEPVLTDGSNLARDQFVLFEKFLVAPVIERDAELRNIYLPRGRWYEFGKPETPIEGGTWLSLPVTLDSIPLFVRAGSIVVRNTVADTVALTLAAPERHEIYPDENGNGEGYWYSDDLSSLQPKNAQRVKLKYKRDDRSVTRVPEI